MIILIASTSFAVQSSWLDHVRTERVHRNDENYSVHNTVAIYLKFHYLYGQL